MCSYVNGNLRLQTNLFCLSVAREFVAAKIRNQRTLLRRNHLEPPPIALTQLKRYAEAALNAEDLGELLGIEGNAARIYFANFTGLVKTESDGEKEVPFDFDFTH